jgi:hypothetical protein
MSKKHKILVAVLLGALILLLPILGQHRGFKDGKEAGRAAGLVEGQNQGRSDLLAEGSQWYCIHAETEAKAMFCTDDVVAWASMCEQAKANGEVNPGLTILGCPIGTFIPASE